MLKVQIWKILDLCSNFHSLHPVPSFSSDAQGLHHPPPLCHRHQPPPALVTIVQLPPTTAAPQRQRQRLDTSTESHVVQMVTMSSSLSTLLKVSNVNSLSLFSFHTRHRGHVAISDVSANNGWRTLHSPTYSMWTPGQLLESMWSLDNFSLVVTQLIFYLESIWSPTGVHLDSSCSIWTTWSPHQYTGNMKPPSKTPHGVHMDQLHLAVLYPLLYKIKSA